MHTAELNYYHVLGVSETATTSDIKKRYRSLCKQFHPDTSTGDEKKMAQINAAYAVLSDPIKRHRYEPVIIKSEPIATKPSYSQRYHTNSGAQAHTQKNNPQKRHYVSSDPKNENNWSRAFTYGFAVLFLLVLAAFAVPAANNYLVAYEAKAADNSPTTQTPDTSQAAGTNTSNGTPNQTTTPNAESYTNSSAYNDTPVATDATPAMPSEEIANNPDTTATTPTTPESSGMATNQKPTETQKTNNKRPNHRTYPTD